MSMALGEWISVRSSAEAFQRQVQIEKEELQYMPEEEEEELALIYQAKGLTEDDARADRQAASFNRLQTQHSIPWFEKSSGWPRRRSEARGRAAVVSFLMFAIRRDRFPCCRGSVVGGGIPVNRRKRHPQRTLVSRCWGQPLRFWTGRGTRCSRRRECSLFGLARRGCYLRHRRAMIGVAAGI